VVVPVCAAVTVVEDVTVLDTVPDRVDEGVCVKDEVPVFVLLVVGNDDTVVEEDEEEDEEVVTVGVILLLGLTVAVCVEVICPVFDAVACPVVVTELEAVCVADIVFVAVVEYVGTAEGVFDCDAVFVGDGVCDPVDVVLAVRVLVVVREPERLGVPVVEDDSDGVPDTVEKEEGV